GIKEEWEAGFAHRAVLRNERRAGVGCAAGNAAKDDRELRVDGRTGAAGGWLSVAPTARIQIKPGSETDVISGNGLMFIELTESGVEKCQIICIRGYRCQRLAGACRAATNS